MCGIYSHLFFIIFNSNQTPTSTAETEAEINVVLESTFFISVEVFIEVFCERLQWELLGIVFPKRYPRMPEQIKFTTGAVDADNYDGANFSLNQIC